MPAISSSDPGAAEGVPPEIMRSERVVDAFELGRRRRAAEDAAEIRLLAAAAATVATPPGATPEQVRRADVDRRALVADLATSARVSEWTVQRLLAESADLCIRFAAGVDALARGGRLAAAPRRDPRRRRSDRRRPSSR